MANIKLRSPYMIYSTSTSSAAYSILTLNIEGVDRYTLRKNVDASYGALWGISELSRDYLDITFDGTYPTGTNSQYIDIIATIGFYTSADALIGSLTSYVHDGFDSWSEFSEGVNKTMNTLSLAQSNTTMYVPENTSGVIPSFGTTGILYNSFNTTDTSKVVGQNITVTIVRICEPKFNPIKVTFVNKYGALQDLWFDKKSTEELQVKRNQFNASTISTTGTYSTTEHARGVIDVVGNEGITMSTGFVGDAMNEVFKELMLSEQCWLTISSTIYPINVKDSSLKYKTSLNDRLVNFTIQFNYAFNLINNIS